ncbi:MAG: hypothetical protein AB7G87_03510 [Clostridia bacterium]
MIPIYLVGIALGGRLILSKSGVLRKPKAARTLRNRKPLRLKGNVRVSNKPSPLSLLVRSFTGITKKVTSNFKKEDLNEVVKQFIPADAKLIIPQYPVGISGIQSIDLDGDRENELVTSYQINNETITVILKKQNNQWNKIHEMKNSDYQALSYIDFADVRGLGKKDILMGWKTQDTNNILDIFSWTDKTSKKIATFNYNRVEVLDNQAPSNAEIAVWNKIDDGSFDIKLLMWNGTDFVPARNISRYYATSAVRYYVQAARQKPMVGANWYYLSDALIKAEMYRDALVAIEMGSQVTSDLEINQKLLELRRHAVEKMY